MLIMAHVMACCLTAPSHYLNQWPMLTSHQLSPVTFFTEQFHMRHIYQTSITKIYFKTIHIKFHSNLTGANELTRLLVYLLYFRCLWSPFLMPLGHALWTWCGPDKLVGSCNQCNKQHNMSLLLGEHSSLGEHPNLEIQEKNIKVYYHKI